MFTKISTLHAKNSFTLAIVAGNLFAEDDDTVGELLNGAIQVPLPTYFTVGTTPLPPRIIEKIEKDEEVQIAGTIPRFVTLIAIIDLSKLALPCKAKHNENI